jgi:DNA-binding beta-propeller fold protein YncE
MHFVDFSKVLFLLLPAIFFVAGCSEASPAVSPGPGATATLPPQPQVKYAYVSNAAEGSVSIIDLVQDQVVGTVKTGEVGAHGIAASPEGRFGYAALEGMNEVVVIDGEAQEVVARITVPYSTGMMQHGVDISPDGQYLWVGARQGGENRSEVVLAELVVITPVLAKWKRCSRPAWEYLLTTL